MLLMLAKANVILAGEGAAVSVEEDVDTLAVDGAADEEELDGGGV